MTWTGSESILLLISFNFFSFKRELDSLISTAGDNDEKRELLFAAVKAMKKVGKTKANELTFEYLERVCLGASLTCVFLKSNTDLRNLSVR